MSALVVAAVVTIASVMSVTEASARPGHGHGGSYGGHHFSRGFGGGHHYRGFAGPRFHGGWRHHHRPHYRPYFYSGPRHYDGCHRWRRVWTPYGWHMRRVNVCGPRYW